MKKTLLFKKKQNIFMLLAICFCFNFSFAQTNLVLNGTADEFLVETNDNADAWDMTPPSTVKLDADNGATSASPYRALWNNTDLANALETDCGDATEQPGSSSDGNWKDGQKTRGLKISSACRRLYQVVSVTAGTEYTFSIESRSEAENVPTEVFMLNTEITTESGLTSTSSTVDVYKNITNDYNPSKSSETENNFTTTTITFTPTTSKVVIYVRASAAVDSTTEVFYDNISLIQTGTPPPPSNENLVLNGTGDEFLVETNDNADAWDMTPPSTVKLDADNGATSASPYRALWNNTDLANALETDCGDATEQPGSSSDGNWKDGQKTRGLKISSACRRLYQVVSVTAGEEYTFSIESRSESENVPTEVFMLNTEITTESGLTSTSSTVDAYKNITNDYNPSKSSETENNFTTTTITFTPSTSKVVIYVRASAAVDSTTEVFYDNIVLRRAVTASVENNFLDNLSVYPNPVKNYLNISSTETITSLEIYNLVGKRVISTSKSVNNRVNVSNLSRGVYLVKIRSNNLVASKKIIIE